jgi:hypothetical protein
MEAPNSLRLLGLVLDMSKTGKKAKIVKKKAKKAKKKPDRMDKQKR